MTDKQGHRITMLNNKAPKVSRQYFHDILNAEALLMNVISSCVHDGSQILTTKILSQD